MISPSRLVLVRATPPDPLPMRRNRCHTTGTSRRRLCQKTTMNGSLSTRWRTASRFSVRQRRVAARARTIHEPTSPISASRRPPPAVGGGFGTALGRTVGAWWRPGGSFGVFPGFIDVLNRLLPGKASLFPRV